MQIVLQEYTYDAKKGKLKVRMADGEGWWLFTIRVHESARGMEQRIEQAMVEFQSAKMRARLPLCSQ